MLALRAFRWRRGSSIVVLVAAALTIAAAAIGPLYAAAAAESVLQDRLSEATADQTTIAFSADADVSYPGSISVVSSTQAGRGTLPGYGPLVNEAAVPTPVTAPGSLEALTTAVWREGACQHLVITSGTCDAGSGGVVVSERGAQSLGWRLGTVLTFSALRQYDNAATGSEITTTALRLRIVGLYYPRSTVDPFWAGRPYFPFHSSQSQQGGPATIESVFVSREVFPSLVHPTNGTIGADLLLIDPSAIRVADVPRLRADVTAYLGSDSTGPQPHTGLLTLLDGFEAERSQTALNSAVVSAQLALLALLLLSLVITDTSEARGNEVALAKLRGLRPRAVAAVALREPVVLLVLAVPLGLVVAYAGATLLARMLFVAGVPVALTSQTWVAAGIAFAGGLVAALISSRRIFTRPVLEQWSSAGGTAHRTRSGLVVDIVLVVVALAGFISLRRTTQVGQAGSGATSALAWAAPGLLVIAVALLLVRCVRPLLSRFLPVTRGSRRVASFLAIRQVVRRPAGLRLAALLAITIGLATFSVEAQSAAAAGRVTRAGAEVGAMASVSVQPGGQPGLQQQVHSVDPQGRWAMVVVNWIPSGGWVAGRMLGVDASRLAAVGFWSPQYGAGTAQQAAALISPALPPPLPIAAPMVRVRITSGPVGAQPPVVLIGLRDGVGDPYTAISTPLRAGTHDYDAAVGCPDAPCRFFGVALNRAQVPDPAHIDLVVNGVGQGEGATFTSVPAPLGLPALWQVRAFSGDPVGSLAAAPAGLRYTASLPAYASPFVQYADVPSPLPMIATPQSIRPVPDSSPSVLDGEGRNIPVAQVGAAQVLPVVGDSGVLVDLDALRLSALQLEEDADWSVWLGPDAPADAVQRLTAAGVRVDSVVTAQQRVAQLSREGPALALQLLLICALAGVVLAASAVAISVAVTGRRRSYELAALRAVGVARPSLVRACVTEQALLLGFGLLVGVPTGLVVARLALPSLPQTSTSTPLPVDVGVQVSPVLTFALISAVLLLATAVVAGITLVRQAVPDRLREAAP